MGYYDDNSFEIKYIRSNNDPEKFKFCFEPFDFINYPHTRPEMLIQTKKSISSIFTIMVEKNIVLKIAFFKKKGFFFQKINIFIYEHCNHNNNLKYAIRIKKIPFFLINDLINKKIKAIINEKD